MKTALLLLAAALSSAPARAQICAGPLVLGSGLGGWSADAISADGSVVAGTGPGAFGGEAFRWDDGVMQFLGTLGGDTSRAHGLSADGSAVVGQSHLLNGEERAFRWNASGGMQDLGTLGGDRSAAYAASADSNVVVGAATLASGDERAFRWTAAGGLQDLGTLGGGSSEALDVSADGSLVVGNVTLPGGARRAFLWTAASGMRELGPGRATAVSADGAVVVGEDGAGGAFRWTAAAGMEDLGTLGLDAFATDVSADGRVVVGVSFLNPGGFGAGRGFRWTEAEGMRLLDVPTGTVMAVTGVSADGSVVTSYGSIFIPGSSGFTSSSAFRSRFSVVGQTYCRPTVANSTGCGGIVLADGDPRLATGSLELTATLLPQNAFGFFLTSQSQGSLMNAGGSQGTLCLGGSIGRLVGPGQVLDSGASGSFTLHVDLSAIPSGSGVVAVQPGETWNFQCWHRDVNPMATSNFTDAVSITFM